MAARGREGRGRGTREARRASAVPVATSSDSKLVASGDRALQKGIQNRPSGFGNPWLQLGLSVACVFVSEFLLKRGATDIAEPDSAFSWTGINGLESPLVWWAILLDRRQLH